MNAPLLRPRPAGGKPPLRREAIEELWTDWLQARHRAMTSAAIADGIRAGRCWGRFLAAFERR